MWTVVDLGTGRMREDMVRVARGLPGVARHAAVGDLLASAHEGTVRLWDPRDLGPVGELEATRAPVAALAGDGCYVVAASEGEVLHTLLLRASRAAAVVGRCSASEGKWKTALRSALLVL